MPVTAFVDHIDKGRRLALAGDQRFAPSLRMRPSRVPNRAGRGEGGNQGDPAAVQKVSGDAPNGAVQEMGTLRAPDQARIAHQTQWVILAQPPDFGQGDDGPVARSQAPARLTPTVSAARAAAGPCTQAARGRRTAPRLRAAAILANVAPRQA